LKCPHQVRLTSADVADRVRLPGGDLTWCNAKIARSRLDCETAGVPAPVGFGKRGKPKRPTSLVAAAQRLGQASRIGPGADPLRASSNRHPREG
jgi:hypothetical protein